MNPDSEQFDQLRRLLALKRHEKPYPRYFSQFSQQVLARIEAGDRGERASFWQNFSWDAPWLQRLWASFETKPALAATVGFAACALLVSGVVLSDRTQNSDLALPPAMVTTFEAPIANTMTVPAPEPSGPMPISSMSGLAISQPQGSLFQELQLERNSRQPFATRVNFTGN